MPPRQTAREKQTVARIKRWLEHQPGCWLLKVHGGAFQRPGVPDFIGCWKGRFFAIEVKREDGPGPTPSQRREIEKIRSAGGLAIVARTLDEARTAILEWERSWTAS